MSLALSVNKSQCSVLSLRVRAIARRSCRSPVGPCARRPSGRGAPVATPWRVGAPERPGAGSGHGTERRTIRPCYTGAPGLIIRTLLHGVCGSPFEYTNSWGASLRERPDARWSDSVAARRAPRDPRAVRLCVAPPSIVSFLSPPRRVSCILQLRVNPQYLGNYMYQERRHRF